MNAPSVSWACFASPVSLEMPVGEDPAYDPEFLRLGKELESGGSVQGRVTNWAFVEAECSRILRERAKDVRAASWLVVAKANLSGWSGAADGLSGYAAFVERFWSAAHPRRARGRVGFVAWLGMVSRERSASTWSVRRIALFSAKSRRSSPSWMRPSTRFSTTPTRAPLPSSASSESELHPFPTTSPHRRRPLRNPPPHLSRL